MAALLAAVMGATKCQPQDKPLTWELYVYTGPDKPCGCPDDKESMFQGSTGASIWYGHDKAVVNETAAVTPWRRRGVAPASAFAAVLRAQASDPKARLVAIIKEGGPDGIVIGWCTGLGSVDCAGDLSR